MKSPEYSPSCKPHSLTVYQVYLTPQESQSGSKVGLSRHNPITLAPANIT
jgi:hypothetical protein